MRVKDAAQAAKNFKDAGAVSGERYKQGVTGAGPTWHQRTLDAKDNYVQGVQEAIGRDAFSRGVQEAGPNRYEQAAKTTGASNFGTGIGRAQEDYQRGVAPYLDVLRATELPPKGPKGSPNNLARVAVVTEALRRRKVNG